LVRSSPSRGGGGRAATGGRRRRVRSRRRRGPVAEGPLPARDRAVGIAALVAEAAGEPVAAGRERGTRRLVRGGHLHRVRDRTRARVLVVLDGEGDGVGAARAVGVRRVLGRRPRGPVAEGPLPARDRAVGIAALVAEAAGQPVAAGRERGTRRLVRGGHWHRVRDRTRARVLVVLDGEGDGVGAGRAVGVRRIPRGPRGGAIAEVPAPGRDRAVGIAALVGEAAGERGAARRERGGGRLVRLAGRDGVRHRVRGPLVVGDRQGDGVGAARAVGVRRIPRGPRGGAIPEVPAPGGDRAVGIAALVGEATGERGAARRERRGGRLIRLAGRDGVRHRVRGPLVVGDRQGDGVGAARAVGV